VDHAVRSTTLLHSLRQARSEGALTVHLRPDIACGPEASSSAGRSTSSPQRARGVRFCLSMPRSAVNGERSVADVLLVVDARPQGHARGVKIRFDNDSTKLTDIPGDIAKAGSRSWSGRFPLAFDQ